MGSEPMNDLTSRYLWRRAPASSCRAERASVGPPACPPSRFLPGSQAAVGSGWWDWSTSLIRCCYRLRRRRRRRRRESGSGSAGFHAKAGTEPWRGGAAAGDARRCCCRPRGSEGPRPRRPYPAAGPRRRRLMLTLLLTTD